MPSCGAAEKRDGSVCLPGLLHRRPAAAQTPRFLLFVPPEEALGLSSAGAAASLAAACVRGLCGHRTAVELPGGELAITWAGEGAPHYLTGPAVTVFNGEYLDKL